MARFKFGNAAATLLAALLSPALGLGATWLPAFDPSKRVHNEETLEKRQAHQVKLDDQLTRVLEKSLAEDRLSIWIVACEAGDELRGDRTPWALNLLRERLLPSWRKSKDFPTSRCVVILYVRAKESNLGSIAVWISEDLKRSSGLTDAGLSAANGPVLRAASPRMRNDAQGGLIAVVANLTEDLKNPEAKAAERNSAMRTELLLLLASLAIVAITACVAIYVLRGNVKETESNRRNTMDTDRPEEDTTVPVHVISSPLPAENPNPPPLSSGGSGSNRRPTSRRYSGGSSHTYNYDSYISSGGDSGGCGGCGCGGASGGGAC
jgi:hypothetical protein